MKNNTEHNRYQTGDWRQDSIKTWTGYIYIAGDYDITLHKLRDYCYPSGSCFTIEKCDYVYAGGVESGLKIGLIQYPPFPEDEQFLLDKCVEVGVILSELNFQWSFSVVTSDNTVYMSRRRK